MNTSNSYTIEVDHGQTEGWLFYLERGQKLPFAWENLKIPGRKVVVPASSAWDTFCEHHGASWAMGRREEIVRRLGDGLATRWYQGGSSNRTDDGDWEWLCVYPAPSRLQKTLDWLFAWTDLFK
jgi:hypothetical protein